MSISKKSAKLKLVKAVSAILFVSSFLSGCQVSNQTPELIAVNIKTNTTAFTTKTTSNSTPKAVTTLVATPPITATPTIMSIQNRWQKGIPCAIPCLEGITPGLTTITEAHNLLKNNRLVSTVELDSTYSNISWRWDTKGHPIGGYIDSTEENRKFVEYIKSDLEIELSPQELESLLGTPTHIVAKATPDYGNVSNGAAFYQTYLIYDGKGVILTTKKPASKPPELNKNLKFNVLTLYKPNTLTTSQVEPLKDPGLIAWQGYKPFVEYCKISNWPEDNRRYCR